MEPWTHKIVRILLFATREHSPWRSTGSESLKDLQMPLGRHIHSPPSKLLPRRQLWLRFRLTLHNESNETVRRFDKFSWWQLPTFCIDNVYNFCSQIYSQCRSSSLLCISQLSLHTHTQSRILPYLTHLFTPSHSQLLRHTPSMEFSKTLISELSTSFLKNVVRGGERVRPGGRCDPDKQ